MKKIISLLLTLLLIIGICPITLSAAPASNIPKEMLDNVFLDALEYTGYDVGKQKSDGSIFKQYGSSVSAAVRSQIGYGTSVSGLETVTKSGTVTGKVPDISKFEDSGLCCASYVSYVYFNYLPNIAGMDTSIWERPTNPRLAQAYEDIGEKWVNEGNAEKITFTQSSDGSGFKASKDIPIGALISFHPIGETRISHVALYAGYYEGNHFVTHVGNDNGPEISTIVGMSKGSSPQVVSGIFSPEYIEQTGIIEVYKKDTDGNKLEGAVFVATSTEDSALKYVIGPTNSSGYASVKDVKLGKYKIKETVFPKNYRSYGETEWTVTITKNTPDATVTVNAVNEIIPGSCQIVKTSEDGKVDDVEFTITGNGVNKTVKTADGGKVKIKDLKPGTYKVTEKAVDKYEPQEVRSVTVVSNETAIVTFNNVLKRGKLKVTKNSEDGKVEGIKFKLTGTSLSGDKVEEFAVTNSKGIAEFNDVLVSGKTSYVLEELNTAERYVIPAKQDVVIDWNDVTNKTVNNKLKKGGLKVTKNSEDGIVSGIKFRLYGTSFSGINVNEYATTNSNGIAEFKDILIGSDYTLEEINTAAKYVIPKAQKAIVEWEKVSDYSFNNILKKWKISVIKADKESNNSAQGDATLKGAVYGIYQDDKLIDEYTTDQNGCFTTKYYVCGEGFYIKEIAPSSGYLLDTEKYMIDSSEDNYTIELNDINAKVFEKVIKGSISIIKHSDDGSTQIETPEAGAEFKIYLKSSGSYENAKQSERDILVCDEYGFAKAKELPYGVYTVSQTKGWENREMMDDFDVIISKHGYIHRFIINNADFKSYIKVNKIDSTTGKTIPYAGVGFQIYDPDGNLVKMKYTYPQITEIDTFYTADDGSLLTPEKLPSGKGYSLVEVQAPNGYVLDSAPVYFDVVADKSVVENEITIINVTKGNKPQMGIVNIKKEGEVFSSVCEKDGFYQPVYENKGLNGAEFSIYAAEDIVTPDGTLRYSAGEKVDSIVTDENGKALSKELYLGKYEIREDKSPYGMVLNKKSIPFELVYAGQDIAISETDLIVTNTRQKAIIEFLKEIENDEIFDLGSNGEITNITFGLYASEDIEADDGKIIPKEGLLELIHCSNDGKGIFNTDIPIGAKLYVKEVQTDNSYILSDEKYPVVFDYAGQDIAMIKLYVNDNNAIKNDLFRGSVEGLKVDEDGFTVADVKFGLFSKDTKDFTEKNALLTVITEQDGTFRFEDVPLGEWIVKELSCPKCYVLSEDIITVKITKYSQTVFIEASNKYVTGDIKIIKKDAKTGEFLSGVEFALFDLKGNEIVRGVTSKQGELIFKNIRYGKYEIKELKAKDGYKKTDKTWKVDIEENGQVITIEITNKKIPTPPPQIPQTGDKSKIGNWILLSVVSLVVLLISGIPFKSKKKKTQIMEE